MTMPPKLLLIIFLHTVLQLYDFFFVKYEVGKETICVTTLALGSRLRQGLARVRAKREARESHLMLLGVQESVKE